MKNKHGTTAVPQAQNDFLIPRRAVFGFVPLILLGPSLLVEGAEALVGADVSELPTGDLKRGIIDLQFRRSTDLVLIRFRFRNAQWKNGGIERLHPGHPLTVTAQLSPQHLNEQAILYSDTSWTGPPVWSALARPSRIAFDIPHGRLEIARADLLNWDHWRERRVEPLLPLGQIQEPSLDQTAIELPANLILSPDPGSNWSPSAGGRVPHVISVDYHAAGGRSEKGRRFELWHLRLLSATERKRLWSLDPTPLTSLQKPMVRAVWSDFFPSPCGHEIEPCPVPAPDTVLTGLSKNDRRQIVMLSHADEYFQSAKTVEDYDGGFDSRIGVDTLALSSPGGWLNLKKHWDTRNLVNPQTDLTDWTNKTELGRDSFAQTQYAAYLYPFGFHVTVVKTTFRDNLDYPAPGAATSVALLRQFVSIRFVDRAISILDPHLVFTEIATAEPETPHLTLPRWDTDGYCWPLLEGTQEIYSFPFTATDVTGQTHRFSAPQLVVDQNTLAQHSIPTLDAIETLYYRGGETPPLRRRPFYSQNVSFMQVGTNDNRSATVPVLDILLAASRDPKPNVALRAPFIPFLDSLRVTLPAGFAVRSSSSSASSPPAFPSSAWFRPMAATDSTPAGQNVNQVFLVRDPAQLYDPIVPANRLEIQVIYDSRAADIGGLAVPNITVGGFSPSGPFGWTPWTVATVVSDPRPPYDPTQIPIPSFAAGTFDPLEYFGPVINGFQDAAILGVNLSDVLATIIGAAAASLPVLQTLITPTGQTYLFSWKTSALKSSLAFLTFSDSSLQLNGEVDVDLTGAEIDFSSSGELTDFTIYLNLDVVGTISFHFQSITFQQKRGAATSFQVSPPSISLSGALNFVNDLLDGIQGDFANLLGLNSDALAISSSGLTYSLPSISVPDIALGALDISNLSFNSTVTVPFTSGQEAQVSFNFGKAESPFTITVLGLGGGGSLDIAAQTTRINSLEISLLFGGEVSIDLGIIQGSAHVFVGIIYASQLQTTGQILNSVTAYIDAGVSVSIPVLIGASVDVQLSLTYVDSSPPKFYGVAQVTVEIEILYVPTWVTESWPWTIEGGGGSSSSNSMSEEAAAELWNAYLIADGEG
jgi:hypothetical protein